MYKSYCYSLRTTGTAAREWTSQAPNKKNIYRKEIKRERKKDRKKKKTNKQANKQKTATIELRLLSLCTIFLVEATVH